MIQYSNLAFKGFLLIVFSCCMSGFIFKKDNFKKKKESVLQQTDKDSLIDYDLVFNRCDEYPATYPGGNEVWNKYILDSINYPEIAQKNKTQGEIRIKFTVEKDGLITNVEALNTLKDSLTEEAIRVIKAGSKWKPATLGGLPFSYTIVQPITFMLNTEEIKNSECANTGKSENLIL